MQYLKLDFFIGFFMFNQKWNFYKYFGLLN